MEKPFSLFYKVQATDFDKINSDIFLRSFWIWNNSFSVWNWLLMFPYSNSIKEERGKTEYKNPLANFLTIKQCWKMLKEQFFLKSSKHQLTVSMGHVIFNTFLSSGLQIQLCFDKLIMNKKLREETWKHLRSTTQLSYKTFLDIKDTEA